MAGITIKQYAATSEKLERLADGVKQHAGDANFPVNLKEADVRTHRQTLEDLRETYEKLDKQAQKAYEDYASYFKEANAELSKWASLLYGSYGKKDKTLGDFGLIPWKSGGKRAAPGQAE